MGATIIDGKAIAAELRADTAREVAALPYRPGLAVVLVGDDPASGIYVRSKERATVEAGMASFAHRLGANTSEAELLALVESLNRDEAVDGVLVQLPLPPHIDARKVLLAIDPAKDVDGFHPMNVGLVATGVEAISPATPTGCMMLIERVRPSLAGLEALVIGRSNIVGKPMAALLLAADCTVTVAHSRSRDLPALCRRADIIVAAAGRPEMVRGDWIKPGATVIDVGVNRVEGAEGKSRIVGDVNFAEAVTVAGAITPVPGGVGPMTIACLLRNTLSASRARRER